MSEVTEAVPFSIVLNKAQSAAESLVGHPEVPGAIQKKALDVLAWVQKVRNAEARANLKAMAAKL